MLRRIVLAACIMQAFMVCAAAGETMRIAVMDFDAKGVAPSTAAAATDLLTTAMVNTRLFTVVERSRLQLILREQGLSQTGMIDESKAVEVGRLLSASKILVGQVTTMGRLILVSVRIVDVTSGISEFSAREIADSVERLDSAIERINRQLIISILDEMERQEYLRGLSPAGYYLRGLVPGWSQWYTRDTLKGGVFFTLFAASSAYMGLSFYNYYRNFQEYRDLPVTVSEAEHNTKYGAYEDSKNSFKVSLGITLAVYLVHWGDTLFFSKPDFRSGNDAAKSGDVSLKIDAVPDTGAGLDSQKPGTKILLGMNVRF
jgi:TolB-like protein